MNELQYLYLRTTGALPGPTVRTTSQWDSTYGIISCAEKCLKGKKSRAALPRHVAKAGVLAQCHFCHWSMLFGSRGVSKSVLSSQSGNEREVVYVISPTGGEIRKRGWEGKEKQHALTNATIYSAFECSCRHSCSYGAPSSTSSLPGCFSFWVCFWKVFKKGINLFCDKIHPQQKRDD